ncbi:leucine-rich repeat-containing protein 70-like [Saccostrea cucullata]|uniref:leucine-rich repeat-containing protein 70-like n=1 Tax=Saccostrea cuccullata TaxID=36930 RepID=UPI002ED3772F
MLKKTKIWLLQLTSVTLTFVTLTYSYQIEDLSKDCQYNVSETLGTMVTCYYGNKTTIPKLLNESRPYLDQESWKSLTVLGNSIMTIFPVDYFEGIREIETLRFHNTLMKTIPNIFMNLQQVNTMDFSFNEIEDMSAANIQKLGIHLLNLSRNAITFLEQDDLSWIPSVEILDLSNNMITEIPTGFFGPTRLIRKLLLSYNSLRVLTEHLFSGLETSLQELYLAENKISDIHPNSLSKLIELKLLDLSGNPFNLKMDASSIKLPQHLAHLDLQRTALQTLKFCSIHHLHDLEYINLHGNNLECTCDLVWVSQNLQLHNNFFPNYRHESSEIQCKNLNANTKNVSTLEPACKNLTRPHCYEDSPLSLLLQNLQVLHYMVEIRKGKILIHWSRVNSSLIYAFRISVKEMGSKGYFYGPVTIHSSSNSFTIESVDLKNVQLKVCLHTMLNDSYDIYTKCTFVEDESLTSIVGILAGIIFLIPCMIALILVIHYDRKHTHYRNSRERLLKISSASDTEDKGSEVYKQEVIDDIEIGVVKSQKKHLTEGIVLNSKDLSTSQVSVKFVSEENASPVPNDISIVDGHSAKNQT